ncbi:ferredoxin family protein [bacterium]|nr:MAG: ferredoxin family protein [bacterium]
MPKININSQECKGCLLCVSVCPRGLITADVKLNKKGLRPVRIKKEGECLGCAVCAIICPDVCIEVYK